MLAQTNNLEKITIFKYKIDSCSGSILSANSDVTNGGKQKNLPIFDPKTLKSQ